MLAHTLEVEATKSLGRNKQPSFLPPYPSYLQKVACSQLVTVVATFIMRPCKGTNTFLLDLILVITIHHFPLVRHGRAISLCVWSAHVCIFLQSSSMPTFVTHKSSPLAYPLHCLRSLHPTYNLHKTLLIWLITCTMTRKLLCFEFLSPNLRSFLLLI